MLVTEYWWLPRLRTLPLYGKLIGGRADFWPELSNWNGLMSKTNTFNPLLGIGTFDLCFTLSQVVHLVSRKVVALAASSCMVQNPFSALSFEMWAVSSMLFAMYSVCEVHGHISV